MSVPTISTAGSIRLSLTHDAKILDNFKLLPAPSANLARTSASGLRTNRILGVDGMKLARRGIMALAALLSLPAAAAGDPAAGRDKSDTCVGCHGIPFYVNAYPNYRVPKLGGQQPAYLVAALKAYRSGERPHPTMRAQASSMTDQDMEDIAAFLTQAPRHPSDKAEK